MYKGFRYVGIINAFPYREGFTAPQQAQKCQNYPIEAGDI
jgi:hypothetical protein